MASSAIPAEPERVNSKAHVRYKTGIPEPRSLAVADSFLNSFAAEPATASTTAGAIEYSSNYDF